ncbi:tankyrase-1-like [Trichogramma pretiosum]|uniref:tankyrase-1-like n=1 Tax=Trichogramma pretiosum TaxID=7493 RepID=UPI0006C9A28F|nr:tankyrase-1-like [Trichogramma pretiosum]
MTQENKNCVKQLKTMLDKVDWEVEDERRELLRQLYALISGWYGQLPDLRDMFRPEAIDWLLTESLKDTFDSDDRGIAPQTLIDFVIRTGYKDEPKVDGDDKPSSRRTTPIHHAYRISCKNYIIANLFKIYDRFDVNYTDDCGHTHFEVACEYGLEDVVKKFLDHGQDPNCIVPKTGDSPLYLALRWNESKEVAILLLRNGADPNLANAEGSTPLHIISTMNFDEDIVKVLFEISDENNLSLQVNALDNVGDTPLTLALTMATRYAV